MDAEGYLTEAARQGRLSGAVRVSQAGQTLLDRGYGEADRRRGRRNTPQTLFQIASISKQFAAAAILLLEERGALSVHDHLDASLPHCLAEWQPITIHQLLTHTSGIGHWRDFPALSLVAPNTRDNLIRLFQRAPLKFPPGTAWSYSSPAYVLLAHIVERIAGTPYPVFLRDAIFRPLGLGSTGAGNLSPQPDRRAIGYAGAEPIASFDLDDVGLGAGDIWSTTGDVARWDAALVGAGLLGEASLRALFTPHAAVPERLPDGTALHYGYGWVIAEPRGRKVVFHPGDNAGFKALNLLRPDDAAVVILLANDDRTDADGLGRRLAGDLLGIQGLT